MQETIEKELRLKQKLVDFIYDASGEIAIALESYAAKKAKKNSYGIKQQNLTIDLFITEEVVNKQTTLDRFLASANDLDAQDLEIIKQWQNNFIGLFELKSIQDNCYQLMNWLTAKTYKVYGHAQMLEKETGRWQPGEIILTILAPINNNEWFFFSDRIIKGRLSQPKLAVAIGEFRDNYPDALYADAPELLEQAWDSVAEYHQEFVAYLGEERLTLPGYKLNQKISELQQKISQKKLSDAGIDSNKSLSEVLSESGTDQTEFAETAADLGVDVKVVNKIMENKDKLSMVTPKVDLPPEIKQAESVTVFSDPRWGQMFLPEFNNFTDILATEIPTDTDSQAIYLNTALKYLQKYLQNPEANYYIWQQLKQQFPEAIKNILQKHTHKNDFNLDHDLDKLLLDYNKPSTPELPAIASVPRHLNDLFEAAVAQVQKTKSKTKKTKKTKKKKGFLN